MSPRIVRSGRLLACSALLAGASGLASVAHAAQPATRPQVSYTYTIGVSVPLLQLKELAVGIQHGVQVAVAQANAQHLVPGVTFTVSTLDDTINGKYDGGKDANNARQFINNVHVIGEVGPLNSGADKVSEPVYNRAGMVQISPSNTNPDLTDPKHRALYEPASAIQHSPITYFRTCTTDVYQGHSDALYVKQAGYKTVYVTDNQGQYGIGLAGYFRQEAQMIGLKVLGYGELDPNNIASSAQSLATTIARAKPDLVFFGGEYGPQGGAEILADDLRKAGLSKVTFMGGDGIFASDFIKGSSAGGADGALASSVGLDPTKQPAAKSFLAAEAKMFPGTQVQAYDTYAYDAAGVIIHAFARAVAAHRIKVGQPMDMNRRLVIAQFVARTSDYHGATGPVSFNANGDTSDHAISIYRVVGKAPNNAQWVFVSLAPKS